MTGENLANGLADTSRRNVLAATLLGAASIAGGFPADANEATEAPVPSIVATIKAFSETDFSEDLKSIDVPTLVLHGGDDQIAPVGDSAPLSAKLLKRSKLQIYEKLPHGMCTTHADLVNNELFSFIAA